MIFFQVEGQRPHQHLALVHSTVIDADESLHLVQHVSAFGWATDGECNGLPAFGNGAVTSYPGNKRLKFALGHGGGGIVQNRRIGRSKPRSNRSKVTKAGLTLFQHIKESRMLVNNTGDRRTHKRLLPGHAKAFHQIFIETGITPEGIKIPPKNNTELDK